MGCHIVVERRGRDERDPVESVRYRVVYAVERYCPAKECGHCHFVGGIYDACRVASVGKCPRSKGQAWEFLCIGLFESDRLNGRSSLGRREASPRA